MNRTSLSWRAVTLACAVMTFLLAPAVRAQVTVDPPGRTLLLTTGKTGTVKIDAGTCSPSWSAVSSNQNVATVTPANANSSSKRTFKIKTPKGQFSGQATVTITLNGVGKGCSIQDIVVIDVFVAMDASAPKHWASGSKGAGIAGINSHMKDLKKEVKAIEKAYKADLKTILKQLQTDSLPDQPGEGKNPFIAPAWARRLMTDCRGIALDQFDEVFAEFIESITGDAHGIMSLYGLLAFQERFLDRGFQTGGCGAWDNAVQDSSMLLNMATYSLDGQLKKASGRIEKYSLGTGTPFRANGGMTSTEFPISTGGLDPTSPGSYDQGKGKKLKIRNKEATNYVDEAGNNDHGRIQVKGKSSQSGAVTVTYERLDSNDMPISMDPGDFYEEMVIPSGPKCKFKSNAPSVLGTANLKPGKWRITITEGSPPNEKMTSDTITVPTGTVGTD